MNLDFLCLTKRDLENERFDSLCSNGAGSPNFYLAENATLGQQKFQTLTTVYVKNKFPLQGTPVPVPLPFILRSCRVQLPSVLLTV